MHHKISYQLHTKNYITLFFEGSIERAEGGVTVLALSSDFTDSSLEPFGPLLRI